MGLAVICGYISKGFLYVCFYVENKLYNMKFSNANGKKDANHYKWRVGARLEY